MYVLDPLLPKTMIWRSWRLGIPFVAIGGVIGGALGACSLLVPLDDEQCSTTEDCASRGGAFAGATCVNNVCVGRTLPVEDSGADASSPDAADASDGSELIWACLGQPTEVIPPGTQVAVTFNVFDALSAITTAGPQGGSDFTVLESTGVPGITVEGCNPGDVACANPLTSLQTTDDAGQATVSVSRDFNGFFEFMGTNFVPAKLYPGQMLADAGAFAPPVALLQIGEIESLAGALKVPIDLNADASVGHFFFQIYDCFDRHAAGVTFSISVDAGPESVQWYSRGVAPQQVPVVNDTDSLGAGGQVNVPTGAILVTATLSGTNTVIGNANVLVAGGSATFVWVRVRSH